MQISFDNVYEKLNSEYNKANIYTMNNFVSDIGINGLDTIFKNIAKESFLYKQLVLHCKNHLKTYIEKGYFNPIDVICSCSLDDVIYFEEGFTVIVNYGGIQFVCNYSTINDEVKIKMMYKERLYAPIVFHPDAIRLLEGVIYRFASITINNYQEVKHQKMIV